ncbi:MAG: peptidylprolyl isomerase [Chloroflexi bacterium]|nr:peptidylprolyl isomerase [Chloroflexota bacterium]
MNKYVFIVLALLAVLLVASCAPATLQPTTSAPATAAAPAPTTAAAATPVATATPDPRPTAPAPLADGSRPLASLSPAERAERFSGPAATYTKPSTIYLATFVTAKGNIVAELYPDAVKSVNNFVTLAKNGYYDGLSFYHAEPGFAVLGGDPNSDGSGGPGYTIPAEINHAHPRGALGWAPAGDLDPTQYSSGSQFYITLDALAVLDNGYTVFGQVVEGMEIVDKIAAGDKITRIDVSEATVSRALTPVPTAVPTATPVPRVAQPKAGRPLAKLPLEQRQNLYNMPPAMTIDQNKTYQATIESAKGKIVFALDPKVAPVAVNNFVVLSNLGFYDNMPVAYVEAGAYVLLGSPASQPDSHVGYVLQPEVAPDAGNVITGTVTLYPMQDSTTGEFVANGSQFVIALAELPTGGSPMSVFGKVVSGMDVAAKLEAGDVITSITID